MTIQKNFAMKNFTLLASALLFISSCNVIGGDWVTGNGNIRTEKRNTGDFNGVKSSGSIDVEITSGSSYSVSVENDDNLLPYVITRVEDGTLTVRYKNGTSINHDHAKVYVTAPTLNKIVSSGSADITAQDLIKNPQQISVNVSGSGDIKAALDAPAIDASVSGSGNISLNGLTQNFTCSATGSGDLNCGGLQSENTTVKVTGSGNAHVFASVHLSASVFGSGDVYYKGNPQSPEIHTAGSGSVQAE